MSDEPKDDEANRVHGGQFYGIRDGSRRLEPLGQQSPALAGRRPDAWICRRVADFPGGRLPPGAAADTCASCAAPIAYNPARAADMQGVIRVCMQCRQIQPDPIEPPA